MAAQVECKAYTTEPGDTLGAFQVTLLAPARGPAENSDFLLKYVTVKSYDG